MKLFLCENFYYVCWIKHSAAKYLYTAMIFWGSLRSAQPAPTLSCIEGEMVYQQCH